LTYLIRIDNETGLYSVRSPSRPLFIGEGKSLYVAIDNLEMKLERNEPRDSQSSIGLLHKEKRNDRIELTAKVSIMV